MEGKLVEKTGKLMEGLGSGKALNGSKLCGSKAASSRATGAGTQLQK